jgi:diaminopimelate decarboxylase
MDFPFHYRRDVLFCEDVEAAEIAARAGTPCYVYSAQAIVARFRAYDDALKGAPHRVCYAVKANGNLSILSLLAAQGAGFDIVSGGELFRVIQAGGDPAGVIFAGVGKTRAEIEYALETGIHSFNCESEAEIALIDALAARLGRRARIAVRVNPDIDARTHPHISTGMKENKFGIDIGEAEQVCLRAASLPGVSLEGLACHIGSQLLDPAPLVEAAERVLALAARLRAQGVQISYLDLGGGLGVPYKPADQRPDPTAYVGAIRRLVEDSGLHLFFEPGRSIVAEAGALLTRVLYRKSSPAREFIVVDGAMTELIRPALYNAWHEIWPARKALPGTVKADVVGPVCESADFLARDREMANVLPGDLLAVMTSGAYGMVAASNYNARPRPAEVLVEGAKWRVVRERETYEDLIRGEARLH